MLAPKQPIVDERLNLKQQWIKKVENNNPSHNKNNVNRFAARSQERQDNTLALKGLRKLGLEYSNDKTAPAAEDEGALVPPYVPVEGRLVKNWVVLIYEKEEAIRQMKFDHVRFGQELNQIKEEIDAKKKEDALKKPVISSASAATSSSSGMVESSVK